MAFISYPRTAFALAFAVMGGSAAPPSDSLNQRLEEARRLEAARDFDGAVRILLEAVRQAEAGGEKGSSLATELNNLGSTLQDHELYLDAERLYKASIRIWELSFGDGYVAVSNPLNNLASLYLQKGEPKRAAALILKALSIRSAALGPDHPDVLQLQGNLAADLYAAGNYAQAEKLCREVLAKIDGSSPERPLVLITLAAVRGKAKDLGEALSVINEALAILERSAAPDPGLLAGCLHIQALQLRSLGRKGEAEAAWRRALELLEGSPLPDRTLCVAVLRQYAVLLRETHRNGEARSFEKRATEMYRSLQDENLMQHSVTIESLTRK